MKHTDSEVKKLKNYHIEMWNLVQEQIDKSFAALKNNDKEAAREVISRERMVNAQELVVDHHCEDFIAMFSPVAIDLRFVISLIKITNNLERIGDFAKGIATFVIEQQSKAIDAKLSEELSLDKMMENARDMLTLAREALIEEDTALCRRVLMMDDLMDDINRNAPQVLGRHIQAHPETAEEMIRLYSLIRRIERIGDRTSNIAEEIVFYVDAKEQQKKKKL